MGSVGMASQILKEHGIKKLFLGFYPTIIRDCIGLGCYFGTYDYLIQHFTHEGKVNIFGSLLAGGIAGLSFWTFVYPVDYVKTIVQSDSLTAPKFKGSWDCAVQESKKGYPVFFTAFSIMMVRAVVANAFGFACFEMGKKMMY